MRVPKRVVWSEGMFMSPHHLQQQDSYHEGALNARMALSQPYCWGVEALKIDAPALNAGQLRLAHFRGILPDGLVVTLDDEDGPTPRPIAEHFPASLRRQSVHLCAPRPREGAADFGQRSDDNRTRWIRVSRTVSDQSGGPSDVPVEFGALNLELRFGDESMADFVTLKIGELSRDDGGHFQWADDYIPPLLRVAASPHLIGQISGLHSLMLIRQRRLAEASRQRDGSAYELLGADITRFLFLHAINSALPFVSHIVDGGEVSPQTAYLHLAMLLGQLATFSAEAASTGVPQFNLSDLRSVFGSLCEQLHALLSNVAVDNTIRVPLTRAPDGIYQGSLDDDRLISARRYFLAIKSDQPEDELAEQLPKLTKIAARTEIAKFVQVAVPGVSLQVSYRPPPQIAVRAGVVYFALDISHEAWRNVTFERTVAIYLPPMLQRGAVELELLAIPG